MRVNLTDEIIMQALSYDEKYFLFLGVESLIFVGIVSIFLCCLIFPHIIHYFKEGKFSEAFGNILAFVVVSILFTGAPFYIGITNLAQYNSYNNVIKDISFYVLEIQIEDKKLDGYMWSLKDFGTVQVSKSNYHKYEEGDIVYIICVPNEDGKYVFTDWIYSAEEYYRE